MTRIIFLSLLALGVLALAVGGWTVRAARWVVFPSARRRRLARQGARPAFA